MWYSYLGLGVLCVGVVFLFVCSLIWLDQIDARRQEKEHFDE